MIETDFETIVRQQQELEYLRAEVECLRTALDRLRIAAERGFRLDSRDADGINAVLRKQYEETERDRLTARSVSQRAEAENERLRAALKEARSYLTGDDLAAYEARQALEEVGK